MCLESIRWVNAAELDRHTGRDCRYPEHREVNVGRPPWRLGSGNPCRNDGQNLDSAALMAGVKGTKSRFSSVSPYKIGLFFLACMALCKGATASDWGDSVSEWLDLKASLVQQLQYNDNMTLSPTQPQAASGYFLNPSLQAIHTSESYNISVKAQGNIKRYDNSLFDCENYSVGLNSQYKTRRSVFKMTGTYGSSCAYSTQAQETGVIIPGVQSTNYNLAPTWIWQLTPLSQVNLGVNYTNRSYSGGASSTKGTSSTTGTSSTAPTSYQNYDSYTINLGLNHAWDRYLSLNEGLYFMDSQYMGSNASTQRSIGLQLGGQYAISERWSANFSAGIRRTEIQSNSTGTSSPNSSSMSPLGNASLIYQSDPSMFSIGYSNTIMPSALGLTMQNQSVTARYSYKFTPHLSLNINSIALQSESLGGQSTAGTKASSYSRETFSNTVAVVWDFMKNWQLKGSYLYRWQKIQGEASAESNTVMLSLNYALDEIEELDTGKYNMFDNTNVYSGTIENRQPWF